MADHGYGVARERHPERVGAVDLEADRPDVLSEFLQIGGCTVRCGSRSRIGGNLPPRILRYRVQSKHALEDRKTKRECRGSPGRD
jgi:hypothetical protein